MASRQRLTIALGRIENLEVLGNDRDVAAVPNPQNQITAQCDPRTCARPSQGQIIDKAKAVEAETDR